MARYIVYDLLSLVCALLRLRESLNLGAPVQYTGESLAKFYFAGTQHNLQGNESVTKFCFVGMTEKLLHFLVPPPPLLNELYI